MISVPSETTSEKKNRKSSPWGKGKGEWGSLATDRFLLRPLGSRSWPQRGTLVCRALWEYLWPVLTWPWTLEVKSEAPPQPAGAPASGMWTPDCFSLPVAGRPSVRRAATSSLVQRRPPGPVDQKLLSPSTLGASDSAAGRGRAGQRGTSVLPLQVPESGPAALCPVQSRAPDPGFVTSRGGFHLRPGGRASASSVGRPPGPAQTGQPLTLHSTPRVSLHERWLIAH